MPTATLPMKSGSHGSHVHRHGHRHDARGLFSRTSERICDKGFKASFKASFMPTAILPMESGFLEPQVHRQRQIQIITMILRRET